MKNTAILLISCLDRKSAVATVADFVFRHNGRSHASAPQMPREALVLWWHKVTHMRGHGGMFSALEGGLVEYGAGRGNLFPPFSRAS
jgi:hypothetical protein